jgi:hypothetical protein
MVINSSSLTPKFNLGQKELDYLERDQVVARMIVYIRWYDLIDIFGLKNLKNLLNKNVFQYIPNQEMRENFEYVKRIPILIYHQKSASI